ncbi:Protein CBG11212 [Caenorhabditis briggsae]|uniref:Protein CBG11212 n=1 Tax=Caenorhabditis briggsae TaxID=6238 RepID=A8XCQ6_CAEBR|nr:Protein CBG11212 [Caenorhabditis briggsae]CAP30405.1 Protein CBG11212 [Caenorhabditis briggsae]
MSLAWRLLREAIEEGRIIIDTAGLKENVVEYMHSWFPPSPPVCKSAHEDCSMQSTEDLMEKTVHIHDLPSFEDDVELDVPVSETSEIPEIAEVEISPRKDDRLERYLNDAAEKMAAAKKYRKALLSGSTNKTTSRIKKRHNRIYQEIVQEKMSTKFAIPGEAFRDVVDEIMKEEFTTDLNSKITRSTVSRCDDNEVVVRIPLMTQIFELNIQRSESFPGEAPKFTGEFLNGFDLLEWNSKSSLYELTEKITDYYISIDVVILEVKESETDGFHVVELRMDEEEPDHLMVVLEAQKYKEALTLSLDIDDSRSFPRLLRCSNPTRTESFDCEKWNSDDKLGVNLRRLYGELESGVAEDVMQEGDIPVENDSFNKEEDDIMEFI